MNREYKYFLFQSISLICVNFYRDFVRSDLDRLRLTTFRVSDRGWIDSDFDVPGDNCLSGRFLYRFDFLERDSGRGDLDLSRCDVEFGPVPDYNKSSRGERYVKN